MKWLKRNDPSSKGTKRQSPQTSSKNHPLIVPLFKSGNKSGSVINPHECTVRKGAAWAHTPQRHGQYSINLSILINNSLSLAPSKSYPQCASINTSNKNWFKSEPHALLRSLINCSSHFYSFWPALSVEAFSTEEMTRAINVTA